MSDLISEMNVRSIDVFITSRCGLRCSHCFVGEDLNLSVDMDFDLFKRLVQTAALWNTKEITFLGGEPTMYPRFVEAVEFSQAHGFRTRIVTNGHTSYGKFLDDASQPSVPFVCFSIDGSTEAVHDRIRGKGSFKILVENIQRSIREGIRIGGIVSLSRQNAFDIEGILELCDKFQFEYVNVHYVTNRGFASSEVVMSVHEWNQVYSRIVNLSKHIKPELRVERTFFGAGEVQLKCAVVEKSNLMFYPDGRVYMCMMFIDRPASHSFVWTLDGLKRNESRTSEQEIVKTTTEVGCPAMHYVNDEIEREAVENKQFIQCIYAKERLKRSLDRHDSIAGINFENISRLN